MQNTRTCKTHAHTYKTHETQVRTCKHTRTHTTTIARSHTKHARTLAKHTRMHALHARTHAKNTGANAKTRARMQITRESMQKKHAHACKTRETHARTYKTHARIYKTHANTCETRANKKEWRGGWSPECDVVIGRACVEGDDAGAWGLLSRVQPTSNAQRNVRCTAYGVSACKIKPPAQHLPPAPLTPAPLKRRRRRRLCACGSRTHVN